jgi:hypothetical protein
MGEMLALPTPEFTTLWADYRRGDGQAQERLLTACYQELRFFAGLQIDEIAGIMGLSASTLKRHWKSARAWLLRDLTRRP